MTSGPAPQAEGLGLDAAEAFRWPLLIVGALAGIAGALDAVAFSTFGIFTANQAGNLVLVWVRLPTEPDTALLSAASLLGCAFGIALVVARRMRMYRKGRPLHPRNTLILALVLLALTTILISVFQGDSRTWPVGALVIASAVGLGVLGASIMLVGGHHETVIGSTGAYMASIRLAVVRISRGDTTWRAWWTIAVIPVCWSAGAALTSLTDPSPVAVTVAVCLVFTAVLVSLRRVASHQPQ